MRRTVYFLLPILLLLASVPAFAQVNLLPLVQQVAAEHPDLLRTNTAATCHEFTKFVLARLKAEGYTGWGFVGKTNGEGQYRPAVGYPRQVGPYTITGVSHDAIASATQRVDLLGGGNDGDTPLGTPATPQWLDIPREHWRPNNPVIPYDGAAAPPVTPPAPTFPPYPMPETAVDGAGSALFADFAEAGQLANPEMFRFAFRVAYDWLTKGVPSLEASVAKHRKQWRGLLGLPALP